MIRLNNLLGLGLLVISLIFLTGCLEEMTSSLSDRSEYGEGYGDWSIPTGGTGSGNEDPIPKPNIDLKAAAENDTLVVVVGNRIYSSVDDSTWINTTPDKDFILNDVVWDGNRFLAVGDNSMIVVSVDGLEWTFHQGPSDIHFESVIWDGTRYLATAHWEKNYGEKRKSILTSDNGLTWIIRDWRSESTKAGKILRLGDTYISYSNGIGCAVGVQGESKWAGTIQISSDGIIWSSQLTNECMYYFRNVVEANGRMIGVNCVGLFESIDGLDWQELRPWGIGSSNDGRDLIAWSGKNIVSFHTGNMTTSTDGIEWIPTDTYYSPSQLNDLRWTGRRFIAVGLRKIMTSEDGIRWLSISLQ